MYADCMFCSKSLGANEVLETMPVGRRIAFDAERGRLWVVCRRCERWNLTPIEERWEPVEACERIFEELRLRASTENIGLGRHPEGLELVRIGKPQRPEFAAWRYGDQFGRRRKRAITYGVAGGVAIGALFIGGAMAGIAIGPLAGQSPNLIRLLQYGGSTVKLQTSDGRVLKVQHRQLQRVRVEQYASGWSLTVPGWRKGREEVFRGEEAERAAGLLLTRINHSGGNRKTVQDAVHEIETTGDPRAYMDRTVARLSGGSLGREGKLSALPVASRLALEMALHEERERRALEGELKGLEMIWRAEEEMAAISDDLLLPEGARDRLGDLHSNSSR
jgi:hypothetical protein